MRRLLDKMPVLDGLGYVSISAGMALAASCYMVLGMLAASLGPANIAWVIAAAGAMCLLFALAIGEMSSRYPSSPGVRTYLKRAFGDRFSLFFTYLSLMVIPLIAAVEIKVFLDALLPAGSSGMRLLYATGLVALLACLNLQGRDLPRLAQTAIFLALVLISLGLSSLALTQPAAATVALERASHGHDAASLATAVGTAFFLFVGFEWVAPMARSVRAAERTVPWSMVASICLLALMYILFGLALTLCLPASVLQASKAPHIDLGRHLLAEPGRALLQLVSLLALLTTLNAGLMSASRLLYGLARERALGARLSSRLIALNEGGVPWAAVLTLAGLSLVAALIVILTDGASQMAQIGAGLYTLVYCAFAASHIRLRRMQGGALPPFRARIPLGVYVALVVISAGVGVATLLSALEQNLAGQCLLIAWTVAAIWLAHRVAQERSRRAQVA